MLRLWGATQGITAYYIGQNVFQFKEDFERRRVLNGAPWLFDNCLLLRKGFEGSKLGP